MRRTPYWSVRWAKVKGHDVLRVRGSAYAALPTTGRKNSRTFEIFKVSDLVRLTQVRKGEVKKWLTRKARAEKVKPSGYLDAKPARRKSVRKNPIRGRSYRKAIALYRDFHGEEPKHVDDWDVEVPSVALEVGKVTGILYKTRMDGKMQEFLHEFKGSAQPTLAAAANGRQLLFLGGDYKMTERGIVDGSYQIDRE